MKRRSHDQARKRRMYEAWDPATPPNRRSGKDPTSNGCADACSTGYSAGTKAYVDTPAFECMPMSFAQRKRAQDKPLIQCEVNLAPRDNREGCCFGHVSSVTNGAAILGFHYLPETAVGTDPLGGALLTVAPVRRTSLPQMCIGITNPNSYAARTAGTCRTVSALAAKSMSSSI